MTNFVRIDGYSDGQDHRLVTYQVFGPQGGVLSRPAGEQVKVPLGSSNSDIEADCLKDAKKFAPVEIHPDSAM